MRKLEIVSSGAGADLPAPLPTRASRPQKRHFRFPQTQVSP